MSVYPYKFVPIYKDKIWGGRNLERIFGRHLPPGMNIGESWELADLPEGQSIVANGADAGKGLHQLLAERGSEILGAARALEGGRFPLLLKLLDAKDILSLQVHPDAAAARRLGEPTQFKTECWYVIESRGGYILKGLKRGVTRAQFARAMGSTGVWHGGAKDTGRTPVLAELVERIDVRAGDFHYLPAGTVHALGASVVVAEIQTPSDTTYRVADWGRGREVHVRQALECIRFGPWRIDTGASGDVLLRTPHFVVQRLVLPPGGHKLPAGACAAWMVMKGRGRIGWKENPSGEGFVAGDTILLPAARNAPAVMVEEELLCLQTTLPS